MADYVYTWQGAKTDWKVLPLDASGRPQGDFFTFDDYNRIWNNISYLYQIAEKLYPDFQGASKQVAVADGMVFNTEINSIEAGIQALIDGTLQLPGVQPTKYWADGGHTPSYVDINRWESTLVLYKGILEGQQALQPRLPIVLGGVYFAKI